MSKTSTRLAQESGAMPRGFDKVDSLLVRVGMTLLVVLSGWVLKETVDLRERMTRVETLLSMSQSHSPATAEK